MKLLLLLYGLFVVAFISAQDIVQAEYFYDLDPGVGRATMLSVDGSSEEIDFDLSTDGLANGAHLLGMRFKDDEDRWGLAHFELIIVDRGVLAEEEREISGLKSYIDNYAQGEVASVFTPTSDPEIFEIEIDLPDTLATGAHSLLLQGVNEIGQVGHLKNELFIINNLISNQSSKVSGGEYYIDTIRQPGQGTSFELDSSGSDLEISLEIPVEDLGAGVHQLSLRFRNEIGAWNFVKSQLFIKNDQPIIKDHPGLKGIEFSFVDPTRWTGTVDSSPNMSSSMQFREFGNDGDSATIEFQIPIPDSLQLGENHVVITGIDKEGRQAFSKNERFDICLTVPEKPETYPITICEGRGIATLAATGNTNASGLVWYDRISGENVLNTTTDTLWKMTDELSEDTSFYVAYSYTGGCSEGNRTEIKVDVVDSLDKPFVTTVNKQICPYSEVSFSPTNAPDGGTYWWYFNYSDSITYEGDVFTSDTIGVSNHVLVAKSIYKSVVNDDVCVSPDSLTMTIRPKICHAQKIVFPPIEDFVFEPVYKSLDAYAVVDSFPESRLAVTYVIDDTTLAELNETGDSIRPLKVGVVKLTAYQAGNDTVSAAVPVSIEFNVLAGSNLLSLRSNSPVCTGTNLHMFADSLLGATYELSGPNDFYSTSRSVVRGNSKVAYAGIYTIKATRTNESGEIENYVATTEVIVNPRAAPIDIIVEENGECENKAYTLYADGDGFNSYQWYSGGIVLGNETDTVLIPSRTGSYNVQGYNNDNCNSQSEFKYVNLEPTNVPYIERLNDPVRLQASAGDSYQWYINNYFIGEGNQQQLPIFVNGEYKVQVTNTEGCTYMSEPYEIYRDDFLNILKYGQSVSLSDLEVGQLFLSPNPAKDRVELLINKSAVEVFNYEVYSVLGEKVLEGILQKKDGIHYRVLNTFDLVRGTYLVRVYSNNFFSNLKLEIE